MEAAETVGAESRWSPAYLMSEFLRTWRSWSHLHVVAPAAVFSLAVTFLLLARHGVELYSYEYPFYADMFRFSRSFDTDPLASTFAPGIVSYLFRVVYPIYDIPAAHLLLGAFIRFALVLSIWALARYITRSSLAATLSVLASFHAFTPFGWGPFSSLPSVPLGTMSSFKELDDPVYLSFRGPALILVLVATYLFMKRRYVLSSCVLGVGFYIHAINATSFFLVYALSMLVITVIGKVRASSKWTDIRIGDVAKFVVPFLIIVLPQVISSTRLFSEVSSMPFGAYWEFILNNEPDDLSTRWNVLNEPILAAWFAFSAVATIGFFAVRRSIQEGDDAGVPIGGKLLLAFIWVPWALIAISYVSEIYMSHVPGFLGDVLIPTRLHYTSSVSALFSVILVSWEVSIFLRMTRFPRIHRRIRLDPRYLFAASPERTLLLLAGLAFVAGSGLLVFGSDQRSNLRAYAAVSHESPAFFVGDRSDLFYDDPSLPTIPMSALVDLCEWVQTNTEQSAAFFNPPYIKEFRTLCRRQAFLSEKFDGILAIFNRKYATVYLQRFSDLLTPLSYDNLPGPVFEGGRAYAMIREKYLSLTPNEIEALKRRYPQYSYWVTEVEQRLSYPIAYANDFFVVYKLK